MCRLTVTKKSAVSLLTALSLLICSLFLFSSCSSAKPITLTSFALDTVCQITVYKEKDRPAAQKALELLKTYESVFSRTREDAELYKLNQSDGKAFTASDELYTLIGDALSFSELSGGAFDITLGAVSDLYHFSESDPVLPEESDLKEALSHSGYRHVHLLEDHEILIDDPSCQIDLGAIAKGYIADRLKESLASDGVENALISLGGNLLAIGQKPDKKPFVLGIRYPDKTSQEVIKALEVTDVSLVTSGTYERSFEIDGQLYHHILDSQTGYPIDSDLASVSIVCNSGMDADILSTACFIAGYDETLEILEKSSDVEQVGGFEAEFIYKNGDVKKTAYFEQYS